MYNNGGGFLSNKIQQVQNEKESVYSFSELGAHMSR